MSTYKLIQDIEAEDHILGPLTLRQFIFGLIAAFLLYICFILVIKHAAFLLVLFLPPALFCAFFAFPFGGDQPTELWALAKLRFWFKPRKRIWNQSGIKELVTINVPKKIERVYSDGLSQSEVKSRLQALANTIDSRGWAVKHVDAIGYIPQQAADSDRLLDIPEAPREVPDSAAADDILDADHNPIAQQFDNMINKSTQDHRQRLIDQLRSSVPAQEMAAAQPAGQWFMSHNPVAPAAAPASIPVPMPVPTASDPMIPPIQTALAADDDAVLTAQLKSQAVSNKAYGNLRTLQPLGAKVAPGAGTSTAATATLSDAQAAAPGAPDNTSPAMTASSDPAILSLSNNNDLNVATIAREAHRAKQDDKRSQDEVVVSLH